jgi:hypothetical protein
MNNYYAGAIATGNHYGTSVIHYSDFDCGGNEQTSCSYSSASSYCSHSSDVGVICRGNIKAIESCRYNNCHSNNHGKIYRSTMQRRRCALSWWQKICKLWTSSCINGNWSRLCAISATHTHASVIYKQLGLPPQGNIHISTHNIIIPRLLWLICCC